MKKIVYRNLLILLGLLAVAVSGFGHRVMAQPQNMIKIFDGRADFEKSAEITESEKQFVEKLVRKEEKKIRALKENEDFRCKEDSFRIEGAVTGSFTSRKAAQKAYLYQLCMGGGEAQYATFLGGIIIAENNEPVSHYVFSNVSGYNNIRALPDINRNGLDELTVEYDHSINGLRFARSVVLIEIDSWGIRQVADIGTFSRIGDSDVAYEIYAKKGKSPIFYRSKYESEPMENKWAMTEKAKNFDAGYTKEKHTFTEIYIYKFNAPTLTAEDIGGRILNLAKAVEKNGDISPGNVEKITGIKVSIDPKDRKHYGFRGQIAGLSWFYYLRAEYQESGAPSFRFGFGDTATDDVNKDFAPVCSTDFEDYKKALSQAGFSGKPIDGYIHDIKYVKWWEFFRKTPATGNGTIVKLFQRYSKGLQRPCLDSLIIEPEGNPLLLSLLIPPPAKPTPEVSPALTSTEIGYRLLRLIKKIRGTTDLSPKNIEKATGIKVDMAKDNKRKYWFGGQVLDEATHGETSWSYNLTSLSDDKNSTRVIFSFNSSKQDDNDLSPVCGLDLEGYKKELAHAGISLEPYYAEHGRLLSYDYRGLALHLNIYFQGKNSENPTHHCINMITIQANDSELPKKWWKARDAI